MYVNFPITHPPFPFLIILITLQTTVCNLLKIIPSSIVFFNYFLIFALEQLFFLAKYYYFLSFYPAFSPKKSASHMLAQKSVQFFHFMIS